MKQRAAQTKAKTALNGVQKVEPKKTPQQQQKEIKPAAEEVVAEIKGVATRNKKQAPVAKVAATPKKVVPEVEPEVKEEQEVEEEDDSQNGADIAEAEGVEEMEHDEDVEEEEMEGDEDLDNVTMKNENCDVTEEDDEAPTEAPISKKSLTKATPGKINTGNVPSDIPDDHVLFIKGLPKKFKQVDIVEVFAKYGTIHTINPVYNDSGNTAVLAFHEAEAAQAALAASDVAQVKGSTITVTFRKSSSKKQKKVEEKLKKQKDAEEHKQQIEAAKDRTLYVKSLKKDTTEEQLKEHFAEFGTVESVRILSRKNFTFAFVVFGEKSEAEAGKKQHNSVLNGSTIGVYLKDDEQNRIVAKDPKRTILIKNTRQLESLAADKINSIFSQFGEIQSVDILCKKNVLAFVTFGEEKEAQEALKLSGTTVEELELEIEEYKAPSDKPKTAVFVSNVKPGVTEEEIRAMFAETGEIESVFLKTGFSIVRFKEVDAFCRSFLLNEHILSGQMVFLEPYSEKKKSILKHNTKPQFGKRRPVMAYHRDQKKFRSN